MPSGWSWFCVSKRQCETEVTSKRLKPSKTRKESRSGSSSKRKLFGFRWLRGKGGHSVSDFGNVKENHPGALQSAPLFPHDAPKSKGIERSLDEDFREEMKQLEERIEGTNFTKRPRAYEIFQAPSPQRSHVSEPCLSQGSVSPDLMRDRGGQGRGGDYDVFTEGRERERREGERRRGGRGESVGQYHGEDQKQRKDNNFLSRIPSQGQVRSPPRGRVLGQDRGFRQPGMGARRSESMYAYVPRAVSLHDASALLFGQEKEDVKRGHLNMALERFATTPTVEEDLTRPMSASPRLCHSSSPFSFVTNAAMPEAEGTREERKTSGTSYENSSGTTAVVCRGNNTKLIQGSRENVKDDEEFMREDETNSPVLGTDGNYSRMDSPLTNERKSTNVNRDSLKRTNDKPLKGTSPMIIDNCLFSADSNSSQRFSGNGGTCDNEDNDSDVSSLMAHFDKLNGNDGQSHANSKHLEGIFGSPEEVLY